MNRILIRNIDTLAGVEYPGRERKRVCGAEMSEFNVIRNAFLLISEGEIENFGSMEHCMYRPETAGEMQVIDAAGKAVLPCWCDSHTHLVYAASREGEFIDKIRGMSYEEIARRGGGILNSARRLHETPEEELFETASLRLREIMSYGTGAVEIKSGYGLNTEDELKMLRVIRRLKQESRLTIRASFLGAHAVPAEYKGRQEEYVDMLIGEMLPRVAEERLADYVDVFCDRGFFTVDETARILDAAGRYGLIPKIHANELDYSGGIQTGVQFGALSVDHLEYTGEAEIRALKGTATMPTILPGAAFFLGLPYAPAREMIDAGLGIAMASDYNPGSSPSGNMQFILSMACIKYRLLPEEALNAVTLNTAYAMGISDTHGSVAIGKRANVFITRTLSSLAYLPYAFGENKVETVIIGGKVVQG
ncbi:MAG TPA: imidazolonepropionase [Bacteroidales bacterium]|nr:imidazolonepropionase [Bacteroidales bacterium]HSA44111.1 imidazolonepropionase [Bacteroidales bacterium]